MVHTDVIEEGVKLIIEGLGLDINDPNFVGTPGRVQRALAEMTSGLWMDYDLEKLFTATFPSDYDQMIVARNVCAVGVCPHHLLPVEYTIHVGYIPSNGKVLGVSKLARLAKILAKRPVLQEQLTEDIVGYLCKYLEPRGVGVVVIGKHSCMRLRGVEAKESSVVTSIMRGDMLEEPEARAEFISLTKEL